MAIKIVKKEKAKAQTEEATEVAVDSSGKVKQDPKAGVTKSFLKTGKAALKALEKEDEKVEQDAALRTAERAFWLKAESSSVITFLDGDLDEDGMLQVPLVYNHNVYNANMGAKGERIDITCVKDEEPCPLCEFDKSSLVGLLTVVEHVEYTANNGEVVTNPRRLYLCKRGTLRDLQEAATELGGLRGQQFKVRRTGKRKATVGDEMEYVGHLTDEQMEDNFPDANAIDYEKALVYLTAEEMYEKGVVEGVSKGTHQAPVYDAPHGGGAGMGAQKAIGKAPSKSHLPSDFESEL
ncbi:hypothetical protein VH22019_00001 [Vibrio phage VH2_2019]|nr:hypothetical protein VH22019_00001 [Vibrio phage VH2_2019]